MRKNIILFLTLIPLLSIAQTKPEFPKKWNLGIHLVHHSMNAYNNYSYPRLSAEYRFSNFSSTELMLERVGKIDWTSHTSRPSERISAGFKLNLLPWITHNEWMKNNLIIYNSVRFMLLFEENGNNHRFLYAPGVECYVYKNLGINTEFVFGEVMKTTFAIGIKYRF